MKRNTVGQLKSLSRYQTHLEKWKEFSFSKDFWGATICWRVYIFLHIISYSLNGFLRIKETNMGLYLQYFKKKQLMSSCSSLKLMLHSQCLVSSNTSSTGELSVFYLKTNVTPSVAQLIWWAISNSKKSWSDYFSFYKTGEQRTGGYNLNCLIRSKAWKIFNGFKVVSKLFCVSTAGLETPFLVCSSPEMFSRFQSALLI